MDMQDWNTSVTALKKPHVFQPCCSTATTWYLCHQGAWAKQDSSTICLNRRKLGRTITNNVEAVLRSYIQKCNNANFIFSGSERHLLSEMFHSPSRPFYASTTTMRLEAIDKSKYAEFAMSHFANNGRIVSADIVNNVYEKFEGITWYLQKIMNCIFSLTSNGETCSPDIVDYAISEIMRDSSTVYADLLYQLTSRQRELLMAISKEGKASAITSSKFIKRYALPSASTIQTTVKSLLERQLITVSQNTYEIYDKFFGLWLTTM